jgi:PAS domain S-box-containing protein
VADIPYTPPPTPCDSQLLGRTAGGERVVVFSDPVNTAKTIDLPLGGNAADPELRSALQTETVRQLVGAVSEFVFVVDRSLHVLMANRGVGDRTAKELEGTLITDFFPPSLHSRALSTLHRVLANGQVDGYTTEFEGLDGRARHFDIRVSPIRADQKIIALALVTTETTEQIRAARAIATQARMIESMLEGVALINDSGVIEITNPAFDTLFGYDRGELIGRNMSTLAGWPFEQPERWQAPATKQSRSTQVEFDGRRSDTTHFAAAGVLSRFDVVGRNHSLLVLQDVSERKQLERAILEAVSREQYRIGNDLHDGVGQELTGIALMLRGLAGRLTTEYPGILPEIENITRLVNNSIESTRALARGLSPVNLERGGLSDALDGLAMHASEIYGVQVTCTHRVKTVRPLSTELSNHLYRIAQEAVRNAVRHGQARSIRLHLHGARAKVRLTITDDGIGMPSDAVDAPGMGLKIMRYRARILGGEVRFERADPEGKQAGTRIVCECPLEPAADVAKPRRPSRRAGE